MKSGKKIALHDLLVDKKQAVLDRWFQLILESYPDKAAVFMDKQKDRFANPAGSTISLMTGEYYEVMLNGKESEKFASLLEPAIKIWAVQEFQPSQAISFIYLLKKAIREQVESRLDDFQDWSQLLKLESKIDDTALIAFDIYAGCREKIHAIKKSKFDRTIEARWLEKKKFNLRRAC